MWASPRNPKQGKVNQDNYETICINISLPLTIAKSWKDIQKVFLRHYITKYKHCKGTRKNMRRFNAFFYIKESFLFPQRYGVMLSSVLPIHTVSGWVWCCEWCLLRCWHLFPPRWSWRSHRCWGGWWWWRSGIYPASPEVHACTF